MIQLRRVLLLAFAITAVTVTSALGAAGSGAGASQPVSVGAGALVSAASSAGPTPAQIRTAVQRAVHSRKLWATINICDRPGGIYQNTIGIRGQMPALGFTTRFSMKVVVLYWSPQAKKFLVDPLAYKFGPRDSGRTGRYQWGANFTFQAPPLWLSGQVTFKWIYKGKAIGKATRRTTAGHHNADDAVPKGYSAATCRIKKP